MLDCVRAAPLNLRHASDGLRADRGLVLEAAGAIPPRSNTRPTPCGRPLLVRARARSRAALASVWVREARLLAGARDGVDVYGGQGIQYAGD